jgi:hypothetical protein
VKLSHASSRAGSTSLATGPAVLVESLSLPESNAIPRFPISSTRPLATQEHTVVFQPRETPTFEYITHHLTKERKPSK